jgi:ATP-dependent DNA helicase RecQ
VVAAFTATATDEVQEDIVKLLGLCDSKLYVTGFDRSNLYYTVFRRADKKSFILEYLSENRRETGIIYAATRKDVEKLYDLLTEEGLAVGKYHAGLNDKERYPVYQFGTCDFHNFAFFSVYINYATNDTFRNDRSI